MSASRLDLCINELVDYAIRVGLIESEDAAYSVCRLMSVFAIDSITEGRPEKERALHEILAELCDVAYEKGIIESDSVV